MGRQRGAAKPKGPEDLAVQLLVEWVAGGRLDDQAEQDVAGVGVRPGRARREVRWPVGHQGDQLPRGPGVEATLRGRVQRLFDGGRVVGHAAGVVEQLADADLVAVGQNPGQPTLQGVREGQPAPRRPTAGSRWRPATWSRCRHGNAGRAASAGRCRGWPGHWRPEGCRTRPGARRRLRASQPPPAVQQPLQLLQLRHCVPPTRNQVTISPLPLTATSPRRWNR